MDGMVGIKKDGIYAALVSPCSDQEKLDVAKLRALIRFELEHGVDGLYCCGSSGEALLLDTAERKTLVEVVAEEVGGKIPFIVHTGSLSTRNAIELSKHAEDNGAAAVSLIPPVYYKYTGDEIAQYYRDVMGAINLGVVVYNIPHLTGISFSKNTDFLKDSQIVGIKHTSINLYDLERICRAFPDKTVFNGFDELWLCGLLSGATASIGTMVNICPKMFKRIQDAFKRQDIPTARELQQILNDFIEIIVEAGVFPAAKYCLTLLGIDVGPCRKPFAPLGDR
jgi:N-acetylneuraminate lyase